MFTLFETKYNINKDAYLSDYIRNEYFTYKMGNNDILITTRHKAWVILTTEEFSILENDNISKNPLLFRFLEDLGIIITESNKNEISLAFARKYDFLFKPPTLFIMITSNRCNLNCRYCHALAANMRSSTNYDMTPELVRRTIDFFLSVPRVTDTFHVEFQGGEPLIRYDLVKKAMDYAEKMAPKQGYADCSFAIVSNLTLMNDQIAQEIKERGNAFICTSLDGPQDIHDSQRYYSPGVGSYDDVTYWIRRLKDKYDHPLNMLPTCTKNHIGRGKDLVDEYIKFCTKVIYVKYVNRTGKAHSLGYDKIGLTVEQYLDLWQEVVDYCIEKCNQGTLIIERKARAILSSLIIPTFHYMCLRRPCGCGISQLSVNEKGDIFACDGGRSIPELKIGDVFTNSYDEVITSNCSRALRTLVAEVLPFCVSCPFSPYCGYRVARGINEHGTPVPTSPRDFECQVYYKMIPFLVEKLRDPKTAEVLNRWIYGSSI